MINRQCVITRVDVQCGRQCKGEEVKATVVQLEEQMDP